MKRTTSRATRELISAKSLGLLFDKAFAEWSAYNDQSGLRHAPRVSARGRKPLLVVSFLDGQREVKVNRRARLKDVSADGLGLVLSRSIPIGAKVRFAFNDNGTRGFGEACVVHLSSKGSTHHIGLVFSEAARSLGRVTDLDNVERCIRADGRGIFSRLTAFCRILSLARLGKAEVVRDFDGHTARMVVDAKMFRYTATLYVDGRKVQSCTGALNDRLGNATGRPEVATRCTLSGDGFMGQACVRSNCVVQASLQPIEEYAAA